MMNAKELLRQTESLLLQNDHITLAEASATQLHNALSTAAMNALTPTLGQVRSETAGASAGVLSVGRIPRRPHGVQQPVLPWAAGRREGAAGGKGR